MSGNLIWIQVTGPSSATTLLWLSYLMYQGCNVHTETMWGFLKYDLYVTLEIKNTVSLCYLNDIFIHKVVLQGSLE